MGLLETFRTAQQIADAAPNAARLASAVLRARQGDQNARAYLVREGWCDGLDLLAPGAGQAARDFVERARTRGAEARQVVADGPPTIEGQFRVLDDRPARPPWLTFQRWLAGRRWGAFPILGEPGSGKTSTALRLAEIWRSRLGWPVEGVQLWPEDTLPYLRPISIERLVERAKLIRDVLKRLDTDDDAPDEDITDDDLLADLEPIRRRIILIDEASLTSQNPQSAERRAVTTAMLQGRHLEWLVLYVGQLAGQLPPPILTAGTVLVKQPGSDARDHDRQVPAIRTLWDRATFAFDDLDRSPWWRAVPVRQAWTYAQCRSSIGRGRGWDGLLPMKPPGATIGASTSADGEDEP